jgi:hypothetical protein
MSKASKALAVARVEDLAQVCLDGAFLFSQIREYVRDREEEPETPWTLPDGEEPLSDSQIRRYVSRAERLIGESFERKRGKLLRRHIGQRRNLYARAVTCGDLGTALSILKDEAALERLYDPPMQRPEPKAENTPPVRDAGDVVKLLAARLRQVDVAEMPTGEKARLTASLADAMLRAFGVDVVDKRLEALHAVLTGRKDGNR